MEDGKTSLRTNDDVGEDEERVAVVVVEQRAAAVSASGGHSHYAAAIAAAAAAIAADAVNSRSFVVVYLRKRTQCVSHEFPLRHSL